jgi:hypothetical protein
MSAAGVVPKVLALARATSAPHLQAAALRLMTNLAFNPKLRRQMVALGAGPVLADVLARLPVPVPGQFGSSAPLESLQHASAHVQPLAMGLLYMASMEAPALDSIVSGDLLSR